jgi:hypothetical protein
MLAAAARRFLILLLGVVGATIAVSLAFGALLGASALRSISLGLYLVGSFLLVGGFLTGTQRPWRGIGGELLHGRGQIRRRTPEERQDALGLAVTCFAVGFIVIGLGIVADSRVALF